MSRSTRAAGKSLATQDQIRSPLRRFFREMIRKQGLPVPNPCDDLGDYMSKAPSRRARQGKISCFTQAEGSHALRGVGAAYLRWLAFIGCCALAGLRWGEAAALERVDIEFKAAVIHVQRTISDKTGKVRVCRTPAFRRPRATCTGARPATRRLWRTSTRT